MSRNVEEILDEAMALNAEERARVAEELLRSLDEGMQGEIEAAWAAEIEERMRAYEAGETKAIPGDVVRQRLMARKR